LRTRAEITTDLREVIATALRTGRPMAGRALRQSI
jgi:hypothetical protein